MSIESRKIVTLNSVQECMDCKGALGRATAALSINFKTPEGYKRKYICMDCEKYYKRSDPKLVEKATESV